MNGYQGMTDKEMRRKVLENVSNNILAGQNKFSKYIDAAKKSIPGIEPYQLSNLITALSVMEGEMGKHRYIGKGLVKQVLEDTFSTTPADIDSFIRYAFDMVTAMVPQNPIEEFAYTQAIDRRVGTIFVADINIFLEVAGMAPGFLN